MTQHKRIIVVGGGAAGFFTAINIAEKHPRYSVTILEKSNKLLSKVKVSGGGRCNVTNARHRPGELIDFYPRGQKKLYKVFEQFTTKDMADWLAQHGVETHTEADQRMFPESNSSQTIIDCFLATAKANGVNICTQEAVMALTPTGNLWQVQTKTRTLEADAVVMAGGSSTGLWRILGDRGLKLSPAVPSLFTFNIKDPRLQGLMGVSFEQASVRIVGSKLTDTGPMLITHWGLSGPAILKLSAWGARELAEKNYHFEVLINYLGETPADDVRNQLNTTKQNHPNRKAGNYPLEGIPRRFWERILQIGGIQENQTFGELTKKQINKLVEELCQGRYSVSGKSTFKEEFVTCGGVKLSEVNLQTFESKKHPGLYLAGELLDIDALTGGFNFQACWSAGWMISEAI
ncbi:BaiN/RdsA family NAD(P)/FAD-dependent oxidoreductase [Marinoscillum furvescens]|uniref:Flavoprotein n=1 Tax=Marinoscillum furvescens DSM 4134 TaxID=1122208 RepID=A0A3D9L7Z1_MARFU|nr:NAD(P)/FAD-dependent oxidoreductase [Marinoscillum furvescens]REE02202.1 hypothetical protein C7460_102227 [Marinoscillum furvescens DSM 4134]